MFVSAIDTAEKYTRAIHTIHRNFGSDTVHPGAATLFFVNSDGWAVTCRHVADLLLNTNAINQKYLTYKTQLAQLAGQPKRKEKTKQLVKQFGYSSGITCQLKNMFVNCKSGNLNVDVKLHDHVDLALLHFKDCTVDGPSFPTFPAQTDLKQGKTLCRLGYPFPEFTNFTYNQKDDEIEWTALGTQVTPKFPIDGMVTRLVAAQVAGTRQVVGFELSTPGLKGQSGGPAFDKDGIIWGVQSQTRHIYLGFDVEQEIHKDGKPTKIQDSAFLHVGICIHVEIIKNFLDLHNVSYTVSS